MSISFAGNIGNIIQRSTGIITSTGNFTSLFAVKMLSNKARTTVFKLLAQYGATSSAHAIASASDGMSVMMYSNYWENPPTDVTLTMSLSQWYWFAQRGNGDSLSISVMANNGSIWTTRSTTQNQLTPNREVYGSSDSSSDEAGQFLLSDLRDWNAVLSDTELLNQTRSSTTLRSANLNTFASFSGSSLAAALTPQTGTAFTAPNGGVAISSDRPSFSSTPAPAPEPEPPAPAPGPGPSPAPVPGSSTITISPGDIIEYHGDSTIRGHNSIDGNRVDTPAPEQFSIALGGIYDVRNEGVGSSSTESLLAGDGTHAPWATYVTTSPATVFIVNHGINDNYGSGGSTYEAYGNRLIEIVNLARGAGKQIILETPNPINSFPMNQYYDKMREVATLLNVPLIDQHQYLMNYLAGAPVQNICPDGTHPSQATYILKGNYAAGVFQTFISGAPAPSPGPDPEWYSLIDATNASAMYQGINLTGQPVVDGNRVGAVLDTSGNGNHWRAWDGDSTRTEYKSADGGFIEISDNYHRGMAIDGTNRLVDVRKPFWVAMAIKLGGPINAHAVLMDKDYSAGAPLGDQLAAGIDSVGLFCEKLINDSSVGPIVPLSGAISTSVWGVASFGYDGTNLTARVNFNTKGIVADTRPLPDETGYMVLRLGGNSPSILHYKAVGFMDRYPNAAEESAAIAEIASVAGISIGTDPGGPPSPAPEPPPPDPSPEPPPPPPPPAPEPEPGDDWSQRPFRPTSPWNEKLSDAALATYSNASDPRTSQVRSTSQGSPGVNVQNWSVNGYRVRSTDPSVSIDVSPRHLGFQPTYQYKVTVRWPAGAIPSGEGSTSTDHHMYLMDEDGSRIHEFFYLWYGSYTNAQGGTSTGWYAAAHSYTRLDGNGWRMFVNQQPVPGEADGGREATRPVQASSIGGLIRAGEIVTEGVIDHALAMAIPDAWIDGRVGARVFPADVTGNQDGRWSDANSDGTMDTFTPFPGNIPYGTRFAIPPDVNIENLGIPEHFKIVGRALQTYGAYVISHAGNPCFYAEYPSGEADGNALRVSDWGTHMGVLQALLVAVDWQPSTGDSSQPLIQIGSEVSLAPTARFTSVSVNSENAIVFNGTYAALSNSTTRALRVLRGTSVISEGTRTFNSSGGNFSGIVSGLTPGDYTLEFRITDPVTGLTAVRSDQVSINPVVTPPGYAEPPGPVQHWIVRSSDADVSVPSSFVGMHFNSLPGGSNPAPEPSYNFGSTRTHDWDPAGNGGPLWLQGEPTQGARNTTEIAMWMNHYSNKSRIWTWYGTPAWAASHTNTGGPYNIPGSNTMPVGQNAITGYIQHVLDTFQPECIEIWNEPEPHPDYVNGWFNGTPQQLATLTTWVVNAIGSRNVTILAPAMTDFTAENTNVQKLNNWANALSNTIKDAIDGFSWHWYDFDGNPATTASRYHLVCVNVKNQVANHFGATKPLYQTEIGAYTWSNDDGIPVQDKASAVARWLMVTAAHGMKKCVLYAHEFVYAGSPASNPVVSEAINGVHQYIAGKTIRQAAVLTDGRVWIELTDGSTVIDGVSSSVSDDTRKRHLFFTLMK